MTQPDDPPSAEHIAWCQRLMGGLIDGGAWALPRSALAFKKRDPFTLVLVGRMGHHPALPVDAKEWAEYQQDDYDNTKRVFEAAGFKVVDETEGKQT